jgi:ABC-type sugar transport system permease subunit
MVPGLLLVGVVVVPPFLAVVLLSLFRIELLRDDLRPFVGLSNFLVRLPLDVDFLDTIPRTLIFAIASTALAVPVALGSALLVNGRRRGGNALGLLLLLPWAVAPIAAGVFWRLVFDTRFGLVNAGLRALGLGTVRWTNEATPTLVVTLVAVTWRATPLLAVLLLGALRAVPPSLARAARMDGASAWQVLRHITLPAIRPTLVLVCVIQIVLALQVFDILFAIGAGHPLPGMILTGYAIYTSVIENLSFGYGSALTVVLAGLIGLCLLPLIFVVRGRVRPRLRRVADEELDPRPSSHVATPPPGSRPVERVEPPPVVRRWRPGPRAARVGGGVGIAAMAVWLVGPIVWLAIASTQPEAGLRADAPRLTLNLSFDGYTRLLNDPAWRGALAISIAISVGATALALASAVLAGYPLARYRFRGAGAVLGVLLLTQLIPPIALAIPFLFVVLAFGLKDTVFGLILVNAAFWTPILVWLVRAAFLAVPTQLESAARMDGLGRLGTIFRVAVPAAGPAIAAAAVIVFIGIWNDFVFAAAIGGRTTTTLPRFLVLNADPPYHVLAAGILLTILPCLVLVAAMHRRILRAV